MRLNEVATSVWVCKVNGQMQVCQPTRNDLMLNKTSPCMPTDFATTPSRILEDSHAF